MALAIFTEGNADFKPDRFIYEFCDTRLLYRYGTYKILDQNEEELEKQDNPFALVILAGLYALKAGGDNPKKYSFKVKLTKMLLRKGYSKDKIDKIFVFLDALLNLPAEMELKFEEEMKKERRDEKMQLTWENSNLAQAHRQKGRQEGKKEGKIEGIKEGIKEGIMAVAKNMLTKGIEIPLVMEMTGLSEEEVINIKKKMD